jgi:hypothetical protein
MKKKMLLALMTVLMLSLVFAGCSNSETGNNDPGTEKNGYEFVSNGVNITMLAQAEDVLSELGEENTYFEAESCAYQGMDKIYTYNGFEVRTNEIDKKDYVTSVILVDDSVATPEGVALFMTKEDMIEAYGDNYSEELGLYTYTMGESKLSFLIKDEEIISIEYTAVAANE